MAEAKPLPMLGDDGQPACELYRSDTLVVRSIPAADTGRWAVTFDCYGTDPSLDRPGFGEHFLASRGVSQIAVIGAGNDWYNYPDMRDALATIRAALKDAQRIMTYGSSMGAYAAIRFAGAVDADACLALSPQYSINPAKAPFETRWPEEAATICWREDIDGRIDTGRCVPVVVFDRKSEDARHVELIAADTPIIPVAIPYGAHPITTYLQAAGRLEEMVFATLDSLDIAALRSDLIDNRHTNPIFIGELARRQPPWRSRLAIALARHGLDRAPEHFLLKNTLAACLTAAGLHGEALPIHEEISNGSNGHFLGVYSNALSATGRNEEALAVAKQALRVQPQNVYLHLWVGQLYDSLGETAAAAAHMREAVPPEARSARYSEILAGFERAARERSHPAALRALRKKWREFMARLKGAQ